MRLEAKRVLITGASSGIGAALALTLGGRGARLVLAARGRSRLEGTAAVVALRHPALPPPIVAPCDVADRDSVHSLCAATVDRLGGLDVLINNAGISVYGLAEYGSVADFQRLMTVNFYGPLYAMLEAIPVMRRQGGGLVVNVASVAALHGVPYLAAYSASKAALAALAQSLRAELHDSGIRLLTVYPGYTRTPLFDHEKKLGGARRPRNGYAAPETVARSIVRAIERDAEELVLSPPGRALSLLRGLVPGLVQRAMRVLATQLRVKEEVCHA
ncbi:MAG: SDR family NAD(P)-dependent oxidoreductase [Gemmatimonadetes bacterium]|nr:SDR family NAD(P)-dependent oxidoreductase [Gemmatimonadota bacterium]MBI2403089.1 SDR family NAD(P)-dependent oxidoreductase [Gemmatimonadota bacterium]MBI2537182.1 SDR family NAD(P)-dependent oxidoreductase [Gemmatimonadota bacterium]